MRTRTKVSIGIGATILIGAIATAFEDTTPTAEPEPTTITQPPLQPEPVTTTADSATTIDSLLQQFADIGNEQDIQVLLEAAEHAYNNNQISAEEFNNLASLIEQIGTTTEPTTTTEPEGPQLSREQTQALRVAEDYIEYSAFSRSGLIGQLEYEGFTTDDATLAVDLLDIDYAEQAAKSGNDYIAFSGFSCLGLIEQLEYEGFSTEHAAFGAAAAGVCGQ